MEFHLRRGKSFDWNRMQTHSQVQKRKHHHLDRLTKGLRIREYEKLCVIVNVTDVFAISHTGVSVKFTMKMLEWQGTS